VSTQEKRNKRRNPSDLARRSNRVGPNGQNSRISMRGPSNQDRKSNRGGLSYL